MSKKNEICIGIVKIKKLEREFIEQKRCFPTPYAYLRAIGISKNDWDDLNAKEPTLSKEHKAVHRIIKNHIDDILANIEVLMLKSIKIDGHKFILSNWDQKAFGSVKVKEEIKQAQARVEDALSLKNESKLKLC